MLRVIIMFSVDVEREKKSLFITQTDSLILIQKGKFVSSNSKLLTIRRKLQLNYEKEKALFVC